MRLSHPLFPILFLVFCQPALSADAPPRPLSIALGCTGCHGASGEGYGSIPKISGKPEGEFVRKMQEFRADRRPATVMDRIAKGFDDDDFAALAKYFGHK
jgi:sulfide dehydrogenase cytochrome subunit